MLHQLIKSEFSKYLNSHGFKQEMVSNSRGSKYFYRRELAVRFDLVEVKFDQYLRPRFVIEFGSVPSEGIVDSYGRRISAAKTQCYQLVENGRLYRRVFLSIGKWFRVSSIIAKILGPEKAAHNEIQRLINLFQQVEDWLNKGTIGSNIVIYNNMHKKIRVR